MYARALAVATVLALPLAGFAQHPTAVVRGHGVGWVLPDDFAATDDQRSTYYPAGESVEQWTQQIRISLLPAPSIAGSDSLLAALADTYRENCSELRSETLFAEVVEGIDNAVQMWHCPEQTDDGTGTVVLIKAIIDGAVVFVAETTGRFPPYARGASPLPSTMLNQWAAFLNSFILCTNRLNPSCLPEPAALVNAAQGVATAEEAEAANRAQTRGATMYRKDELARRATEILGAQKSLRWKSSVNGWVTVLDENGVDVVWFMGGSARRPRPYYAIVFQGGRDGRFYDYKKYKASDNAITMFRARESALAVMKQACTPNVNTVVLPTEDNGGWLVYVLSAGISRDEVYIGGHTRFTVDPTGRKVVNAEALSESCLVLKKAAPESPGNENQAWFTMTHLQHPVPLETHVFQSLNHGVRLFVHTSSGDWRVDNGAIARLNL